MKNSIIKKLYAEGVVTLHADYRSLTAQDFGPLARHGVVTAPVQFGVNGARFQGGYITHPNHGSAGGTTGSIVVLADFNQTIRSDYVVFTGKLLFYQNGGTPYIYDYTINNLLLTYVGKKCVAFNFAAGTQPVIYHNGTFLQTCTNVQNYNAAYTQFKVSEVGVNGAQFTIAAVLETNRPLTATEHAQVYAELSNMKWPTKPYTLASRSEANNNILVDGDMEAAGVTAWFQGNKATLTKSTINPHKGTQVLRITQSLAGSGDTYARQTVMTVGQKYRITGWGRGDGVLAPGLGDMFIWTGTTSTAWQYFDFTFFATATSIYLYGRNNSAGNYVEFDDVVITRVPPKVDKNLHLEGSPISVAARGGAIGQFLENTPLQFGDATGRYSVSTDTIFGKANSKVISCSTAGLLYMPSTQAYGTWEWDWYKGADANTETIKFIGAMILPSTTATVGNNGYDLNIETNEWLKLRRITDGNVASLLLTSGAPYLANNTWYRFRITRSTAGIFSVWLMGGIYNGWTLFGTTGADNTYATSTYFTAYNSAADKIANMTFKPLA